MACPVCGGLKVIDCVECGGKGRKYSLWPARVKEEICYRCEGEKEIACPVCGEGKGSS